MIVTASNIILQKRIFGFDEIVNETVYNISMRSAFGSIAIEMYSFFPLRFGIILHFSKRFLIQVSSNRIDLNNFSLYIYIVVVASIYDSIVSFAWNGNTFIVRHLFHFAILFIFISLTILVVLWGAFQIDELQSENELTHKPMWFEKLAFFSLFQRLSSVDIQIWEIIGFLASTLDRKCEHSSRNIRHKKMVRSKWKSGSGEY